jgi:hypothetical protein
VATNHEGRRVVTGGLVLVLVRGGLERVCLARLPAARPPQRRHDARLVGHVVSHRGERAAEILHRAPLPGSWPERLIDGPAELARKIQALASQGREMGAETARAQGRGARPHRIDPGQRLIEDERQRVEVGGRADVAALCLFGGHVRRRPDYVARPGQ